MKYTNIKKLLIKFMGGGLINFPTRFLRWIKVDGDAEGDDGGGDDGGGSDSNIFLKPASIQPNGYSVFMSDDINNIENLDLDTLNNYAENDQNISFFYSKEEIAKLGFSLEELEELEAVTPDVVDYNESNSIPVDGSIIRDNFIISTLEATSNGQRITSIKFYDILYNPTFSYVIIRNAYGDNNYYSIIGINSGNPDVG